MFFLMFLKHFFNLNPNLQRFFMIKSEAKSVHKKRDSLYTPLQEYIQMFDRSVPEFSQVG